MIRTLAALLLLAAACGGPAKKQPESLIEDVQAGESCCCRIETDDPDDPTFSRSAIIECSSRHGTCIKTDTQCEGQPEPGEETIDSGALPPVVEETPNSF
jgi:hypothetical protein